MVQPAVAVSTVIFALGRDGDPHLQLPLVLRTREPFNGQWALPGGPLRADEGLGDAARRTLHATTGLEPSYLEQMYTFGEPDRSSVGSRVVSIVYWALVSADEVTRAVPTENVRWMPADDLPPLAFDHSLIVEYALWRLRTKVSYTRIAHAFLGDTFTLRELREVHETVRGTRLDPANFRRQIEADGALVATDRQSVSGRGRPARLYRYNTEVEPVDLGPIARTATHRATDGTARGAPDDHLSIRGHADPQH